MKMLLSNQNFSRLFKPFVRQFAACVTVPPKCQYPVVTVLDASTCVGAAVALLLKQNPLIYELRIYDEIRDTCLMSHDLNFMDTRTKVVPFNCKQLKQAIQGAHIVVSTGGCQSKPCRTPSQLLEQNIDNVRNVALYLSDFNPCAIYCIAKPPVEALVPLVSEEYKKAETYDPRRIIGITTHVSMVANQCIAKYLNVPPEQVYCPLIGGLSPKTTLPVISQTKPTVEYNSKVYVKLEDEIATAEEILLKKGSMWSFSKAIGISRFINLLLIALKGGKKCVECAFVAQTGHIRDFLPYMTSIVQLGTDGISSTHMPKLTDVETCRLKQILPHILQNIYLGQSYLNGEFSVPFQHRIKRKCDAHLKQKLKELNVRSG